MSSPPRSARRLNPWEIGAAAIFFLLGLYMLLRGGAYGLGTITRIGPGFFPASIGVLLMLLSVAVGFEVRHSLAKAPRIPAWSVLVVGAALLLFVVLVNRAGLIPATFALVFVSRFAEPGNSARDLVVSAILAAVMALFGWLVFIVGFNLPLKPLWF